MPDSNLVIFMSHAGEDKERFVIKFSEYLLSKGIDVWLDKWEMLPGDSLVEKIFEEGLKNATAVIVVLSKNSINKKWVKEELKTAIIKRINTDSKLIPIILDNLQRNELPQAIQDTVWETITDTNNFIQSADRIIASLYGQKTKPNIGNLPEYANSEIEKVPNLTKIDTLVLKQICEIGIKNGFLFADGTKVLFELNKYEIPQDDIMDSIKILDGRYFIKASFDSMGFSHANVTVFGFQEYAKIFLPNYEDFKFAVASFLINNPPDFQESDIIAKELSIPLVIVNHIIDLFEENDFLKTQKLSGNTTIVFNISPELKRKLT